MAAAAAASFLVGAQCSGHRRETAVEKEPRGELRGREKAAGEMQCGREIEAGGCY